MDDDFAQGRYLLADLLWRATLKRAGEFSRKFTPTIGWRMLDVLHVASAVELGIDISLAFISGSKDSQRPSA